MLSVSFDTNHSKEVEHGIAPPMRLAVTIPVSATDSIGNGPNDTVYYRDVTIYICQTPFTDRRLSEIEFEAVVEKIVAQLEARED